MFLISLWSKTIKILLTSDIHVGLDKKGFLISEKIRNSTFKKIISLARDHDLLLIAGDLIDNVNIDIKLLNMIKSEIKFLQDNGTEVIYTPGLGELKEDGTVSSVVSDLNVKYIFNNPEFTGPYNFKYDDQNIYIYGKPAVNGNDLSNIKKETLDGFHIGLFHVDYDSKVNNDLSELQAYSIDKNDIRELDLDFYALGHNHKFKIFKAVDRIIGVYPGSPESSSYKETGDRYVISIEINNNEIQYIKRLTVNSLKIDEIVYDCSNGKDFNSVMEDMLEKKSKRVIQRLILKGERNFEIPKQLKILKNVFYNFQIIDESNFSLDFLLNEYADENSIRGEFYKILKEKIEQNEISKEIDLKDLAISLNILTKKGFESLEEWLCNLSNA